MRYSVRQVGAANRQPSARGKGKRGGLREDGRRQFLEPASPLQAAVVPDHDPGQSLATRQLDRQISTSAFELVTSMPGTRRSPLPIVAICASSSRS